MLWLKTTVTCNKHSSMFLTLVTHTMKWYYLCYWQAKTIFTKKTTLILCGIMPVVWTLTYSWLAVPGYVAHVDDKTVCSLRGEKNTHVAVNLWTSLYLFIPVILLIVINTAIIFRLKRVNRIHKALRSQHAALSLRGISQLSVNTTMTNLSNITQPAEEVTKSDGSSASHVSKTSSTIASSSHSGSGVGGEARKIRRSDKIR